MRAFSTLEILLALAVGITSVVGASLIVFGTPEMLENARRSYTAYGLADSLLTKSELEARADFNSISSTSSSVFDRYAASTHISYLDDELAALVSAHVRWTDTRGKEKEVILQSVITNPEAALVNTCSPFVFEKASYVATHHYLTGEDLLPGIAGHYPVADIATNRDKLLVSISTTQLQADSTLFLFSLNGVDEPPLLLDYFDNASTSRTGYSAIAIAGTYAFVANGFGSASPTMCSAIHCAQLHIVDVSNGLDPIAFLALPTETPPYAQSSGNRVTPAKSLTYQKGYLYLGLEKTRSGQEFNIIDVHEPEEPRWISGVAIGRSVNDISIHGTLAYLATSDPVREFVIVDIEDPSNPQVIDAWNAPGSTNFGLGNVVLTKFGKIYAGRTYVGNAPELFVFEGTGFEAPVVEHDPGTVNAPQSINGIVVRSSLLAVLTGSRFELWTWDTDLTPYTDPLALPGTGTSLACRGNTFYVGGITDSGEGFITII